MRRARSRWSLLGSLALAVSLVLAAVPPADAQVVRAHDAQGDATGRYQADLRAVRVDHRAHGVLIDIVGDAADYYQVWIDLDPADPGPERLVVLSLETLAPSVHTVNSFSRATIVGTQPLSPSVCSSPVVRASFRPGSRHVLLDVPRACLGDPARVRVAVQAAMDHPGTTTDWAPRRRHFGPWATSG